MDKANLIKTCILNDLFEYFDYKNNKYDCMIKFAQSNRYIYKFTMERLAELIVWPLSIILERKNRSQDEIIKKIRSVRVDTRIRKSNEYLNLIGDLIILCPGLIHLECDISSVLRPGTFLNIIKNFHKLSFLKLKHSEGYDNNHELEFQSDDSLPSTITHFILDSEFRPIQKGFLPSSLKVLKLGETARYQASTFSNHILMIDDDSLTSSPGIEYLHFGNKFNKMINIGTLPSSLTCLKFGFHYNQTIGIGVLPNCLKRLKFGFNFNQLIDVGVLPNSLVDVEFGDHFSQPLIPGTLPPNLTRLKFGRFFDKKIIENVLPTSLTTLIFECVSVIKRDYMIKLSELPNLKKLKIGLENIQLDVSSIPNLSNLTLYCKYNFQHIMKIILSMAINLNKLRIFNLDEPISNYNLPKSLTHLYLNYYAWGLTPASLPLPGLKCLIFEHGFNQPNMQPGIFPNTITKLILGDAYTHPIENNVLPTDLTELGVGHGWTPSKNMRTDDYPRKLSELQFYDTHRYGIFMAMKTWALEPEQRDLVLKLNARKI